MEFKSVTFCWSLLNLCISSKKITVFLPFSVFSLAFSIIFFKAPTEEKAAFKAFEEAKKQATTQQKTPSAAEEDAQTFADYTADLADYNLKIQKGLTLDEKKAILEKIHVKFSNTKVNLSTIQRELKSLKV
mgnify:CR=1 FL=1